MKAGFVFLCACAVEPVPTSTVASHGDCAVDTSYDPLIDPARFVLAIDNPLFPLVPGQQLVYANGDTRLAVTVTPGRREILGVSTVVVETEVIVGGAVVDTKLDYYAQDIDRAVWAFGEDTGDDRSWEAGTDGAKPGLVIPAKLKAGMKYRQEYAACKAEDMREVVSTCATVGRRTGCLQTLDTNALDPDVRAHKFYCPGKGLVLAIDLMTGEREELL